MDRALEAGSERPIAVYGAVAANGTIAVLKFIVAAITGSAAMLSEAFHSSADTINQALMLIGLRRSRKRADATHPFGYGKELYFWSLIVAIGIFSVGGGVSFYEGVIHIVRRERPAHATWSYVVLGLAFLFEGTAWAVAVRQARRKDKRGRGVLSFVWRHDDTSLLTVIAEDTAALLGIAIAFVGIALSDRLDQPWLDGAASIAIGLLLTFVAFVLAQKSRTLLIGEGASAELLRTVERLVARDPAVERAGPPLTMRLGPGKLLLNLDVQFRGDLTADEVVQAIDRLEDEIRKAAPEVSHVFIEAEAIHPRAR